MVAVLQHRPGFFERVDSSVEGYFARFGVVRESGEDLTEFVARGLREAGGPKDRHVTAAEIRERLRRGRLVT